MLKIVKNHLKESEKNRDIQVRAVTLGPESMREQRKGELLNAGRGSKDAAIPITRGPKQASVSE